MTCQVLTELAEDLRHSIVPVQLMAAMSAPALLHAHSWHLVAKETPGRVDRTSVGQARTVVDAALRFHDVGPVPNACLS